MAMGSPCTSVGQQCLAASSYDVSPGVTSIVLCGPLSTVCLTRGRIFTCVDR
jgi:hypothetical protein